MEDQGGIATEEGDSSPVAFEERLSNGFSLAHLSDEALLGELGRVTRAHKGMTAELVAHIAEVDARKLYLVQASPSMFAYCVGQLGCSEDEACRRIDAARIARKWPVILAKIATGEISLTVLSKLKPFLNDENVDELLDAVARKSVRDAERVLAARFPRPDTADSIRKLPESKSSKGATRERVHPATTDSLLEANSPSVATGTELMRPSSTDTRVTGRPVDRGRLEPLSAERIQVKFTASRALEEKIALARDLMSHRNPRGDLATIVEAALDLLIDDALKQKLGVTKRPQKKPRPAKRERVTSATRREVLDRDGLACAFVNDKGERCGARAFLELDHRKTKATGGGSEPGNMRLLCRAHNQAEAERVYGKAHMERCRRKKRNDDVRDRTSTREFEVGLIHPRRRGSSSSAGRSKGDHGSERVILAGWSTDAATEGRVDVSFVDATGIARYRSRSLVLA